MESKRFFNGSKYLIPNHTPLSSKLLPERKLSFAPGLSPANWGRSNNLTGPKPWCQIDVE